MSAQTFDNFIGGSYAALASNLAADTCINLYFESAEAGTGKNRAALLGTPGLAAFMTLPTSPVRGVLVGEDRFFVVAGAIYYEVFPNGTYNARGNVGTDAGNSPVQMFENGTQNMIVSAGNAYIDGGGAAGSSSIPVDWADLEGVVNTSGTTVTWVSGFQFPIDAAGFGIVINGVSYTVASVTSPTVLVLTATAGTQSAVIYSGPGGAVPAYFQNGVGTVQTSGTAVTWVSGSTFDQSNVGNVFYIAGARYIVASVTDSTHLVLTTSAGTQGSTSTGTVNTAGTAVTWVSGPTFTGFVAGQIITIASVPYTIASITDATDLVLASTAPTLTAAAFSVLVGVSDTSAYPVTASCGAFMDGYFIVATPFTRIFQISAIDDGKSWNPLDFGVKEAYGDGIQALLADHEQLWIMGDKTIEVWQDTGAAAFPFQRIAGAFVQMGIPAPNTAVKLAGTVAWLGGDARGRTVAYAANGFIPTRISTHAVESAWFLAGPVGDATSFAYSDQGHDFWVISFPAANKTWVYDFTEKLWHQRGWWSGAPVDYADTFGVVNTAGTAVSWVSGYMFPADAAGIAITINGVVYVIASVTNPTNIVLTSSAGTQTAVAWIAPESLDRVRGATCGYVFDQWIVGDWSTGELYYMSTALYDDAGKAILRARAAPHVSGPMLALAQPGGTSTNSPFQDNWTFYHRFVLDLLAGAGANGNLMLDWSDDGGRTFGTIHLAASGLTAAARVIWRRLGKSRDRVFRVRYLSGGQVAWINAYLQSTAGSC